MRSNMQSWSVALCAALLTSLAAASQAAIIDTNFQSTGSRQFLPGTTTGLTANEPGGNWIVGAGWNWGNPFVPATWDPPGIPTNLGNLVEEKTVLGLSIASSGGYTKPAQLRLSTDIEFPGSRNHTGGVGFFSVMPPRADNQNQFLHFTGLVLNEPNGTVQVMADGALVGSPVSVGTISEGVFHNVSYEIDTLSGGLSNVLFNGTPVLGLSSTAFTDAATMYAAVVVGGASRAYFNHFAVSEVSTAAAVPEPASLALLVPGGLLLAWRWRRRVAQRPRAMAPRL